MAQSKSHSFIEACAQTLVGFVQGILTQMALFPLYGFTPTLTQNVELVMAFTIVSLARSYFVRRIFNWIWLN
jgi:hypothetical protein